MTITLSKELRDAIELQPERPLMFEDQQTRSMYVLMTGEQFQRLVYDDSDLSPEEMTAAASICADAFDDVSFPTDAFDPAS